MRRYLEHFLDLCKNRIFVMLCGVIVLFAIIVLRLFSLQIIHGEYYDESITASVSKTLPVAASRGNIYDRYGRPLAVNTVAYCVQVDRQCYPRVEQGGTQDACYRPDRLALGGWTP